MSKLTCKQCGTIIQTDDGDQNRLDKLMAKHALLHATPEARHNSILTKCLAAFNLLAAGGRLGKAEARELQVEISNLLGVPFAPEEKKNVSSAIATPVGTGTDSADSHVPEPAKIVSVDHDGDVSAV